MGFFWFVFLRVLVFLVVPTVGFFFGFWVDVFVRVCVSLVYFWLLYSAPGRLVGVLDQGSAPQFLPP